MIQRLVEMIQPSQDEDVSFLHILPCTSDIHQGIRQEVYWYLFNH